MYNKEEIEKNLGLLKHVIERDFPRAEEEKARENIIRTNILAEFGLDSLSQIPEDDFLRQAKVEIMRYLNSANCVLQKY